MEEPTNNRPARRRTPPAAALPARKRAPGDAKFLGKFILVLVVLVLFFKNDNSQLDVLFSLPPRDLQI